MDTTFDKAACPAPSPTDSSLTGKHGGFDLGEGTQYETPGVMGTLPTTYALDGQNPGSVGADTEIKDFQADRTWKE